MSLSTFGQFISDNIYSQMSNIMSTWKTSKLNDTEFTGYAVLTAHTTTSCTGKTSPTMPKNDSGMIQTNCWWKHRNVTTGMWCILYQLSLRYILTSLLLLRVNYQMLISAQNNPAENTENILSVTLISAFWHKRNCYHSVTITLSILHQQFCTYKATQRKKIGDRPCLTQLRCPDPNFWTFLNVKIRKKTMKMCLLSPDSKYCAFRFYSEPFGDDWTLKIHSCCLLTIDMTSLAVQFILHLVRNAVDVISGYLVVTTDPLVTPFTC